MPRSDPPPPLRPPDPPAANVPRRDGGGDVDGQEDTHPDSDSTELSIDENEFLFDEEGKTPVAGSMVTLPPLTVPPRRADDAPWEQGDDPYPSPFDRVTMAPPLPEREYVAQMMGKILDSERPNQPPRTIRNELPSSGSLRKATIPGFGVGPRPEAPSSKSPDPPALETTRPHEPSAALTLDLNESIPPAAPTGGGRSSPSASTVPPPRASAAKQLKAARVAPEPAPPLAFPSSAGDALELVGTRAQSRPPRPSVVNLRTVRDRFDVGDFSGALVLAEGILEQDPDNGDAMLYAEHCRDVLKQMYISRLGGVRRVLKIGVTPEQLRWLSIDHRAGFLLSLVDGRSTVDEVLDMSGMPDLEALRLLVQLLQQNVIHVE